VEDSPARADRFAAVVAAVHDPVWRFLLRRTDRDTAAEVLNDVLVVIWRRLDDVPTLEPLPWCYAVARGCLANATRGARRQRALAHRIAMLDPPPPTAPDPASELLDDSGLAAEGVRSALRGLRADDREVLQLWAWEQLEPAEIAKVLGISANAVSIRLHRAKKRLRERLTEVADREPVREEGFAT